MNKLSILLCAAALSISGCSEAKKDNDATANQSSTIIAGTPGATTNPVKQVVTTIEHSEDDVKSLKEQLKAMINTESCKSVNDCALVEIGHRPCGGPEEYQAYSKLSTDEDKLLSLAKKYQSKQKAYQKQKSIVGICNVIEKPALACQKNMCVTVSANTSQM